MIDSSGQEQTNRRDELMATATRTRYELITPAAGNGSCGIMGASAKQFSTQFGAKTAEGFKVLTIDAYGIHMCECFGHDERNDEGYATVDGYDTCARCVGSCWDVETVTSVDVYASRTDWENQGYPIMEDCTPENNFPFMTGLATEAEADRAAYYYLRDICGDFI